MRACAALAVPAAVFGVLKIMELRRRKAQQAGDPGNSPADPPASASGAHAALTVQPENEDAFTPLPKMKDQPNPQEEDCRQSWKSDQETT